MKALLILCREPRPVKKVLLYGASGLIGDGSGSQPPIKLAKDTDPYPLTHHSNHSASASTDGKRRELSRWRLSQRIPFIAIC